MCCIVPANFSSFYNVNSIRRIGKYQICFSRSNQPFYILPVCAITAHKPMPPKLPYITAFCCRRIIRHFRDFILDNLCRIVLRQPPIKIKRRKVDLRKLHRKKIHIPIALVGLIVHKAQGVDLFRRQIIYTDARNGFHAELLCRQNAAMADDDHAVTVDYYRLDKPVLPDAFRHVVDLPLIVLLCVTRIRHDFPDGDIFYIHNLLHLRRPLRCVRLSRLSASPKTKSHALALGDRPASLRGFGCYYYTTDF